MDRQWCAKKSVGGCLVRRALLTGAVGRVVVGGANTPRSGTAQAAGRDTDDDTYVWHWEREEGRAGGWRSNRGKLAVYICSRRPRQPLFPQSLRGTGARSSPRLPYPVRWSPGTRLPPAQRRNAAILSCPSSSPAIFHLLPQLALLLLLFASDGLTGCLQLSAACSDVVHSRLFSIQKAVSPSVSISGHQSTADTGRTAHKRSGMTRTRTASCFPRILGPVYQSGITTFLPGVVGLVSSVRFLGSSRLNPPRFDICRSILAL